MKQVEKAKHAKQFLEQELAKATDILKKEVFTEDQKKNLAKALTQEEIASLEDSKKDIPGAIKAAKESRTKSKSDPEYALAQEIYQNTIKLKQLLVGSGYDPEDAEAFLFEGVKEKILHEQKVVYVQKQTGHGHSR